MRQEITGAVFRPPFFDIRNWQQINYNGLRRMNFLCQGRGEKRSGAALNDDNADRGDSGKQDM